MTTTIISPPSSTPPQPSSSTSASSTTSSATIITTPSPSYTAAIPSWIVDSFVFDEYSRKVNQVSQFVVESKFIEAIRKLVEYGNREFLRSFQMSPEIKEGNSNHNSNTNDNNNFVTTDVASPIPPFDTIGFLEGKWLEVLRELVEYGNKNILGDFMLYLVLEERRVEEEEYAKEVTSGILDIKKPEDKGKEQQEEQEEAVNQRQHHHNGSKNNNNQSWYTRPRDKNGRFTSSSIIAGSITTYCHRLQHSYLHSSRIIQPCCRCCCSC